MSTVTPRNAETLEESSERRVLFCLQGGGGGVSEVFVGKGKGGVLFAGVGFGHGVLRG